MKSVVLSLFAANATAQAPDGTDPVDGGSLDEYGYDFFTTY